VKGAVAAVLIFVLLMPHLVIIYSVLGTEEPGWSHQVREVPVPPRPEGGRVIVVDQSGRGDFRSIGEAVAAAKPGERVLVVPEVDRDSVTHTVTDLSGQKAFDEVLGPGQRFSYRFERRGVYVYYCVVHPWKGGEVRVE